MNEWLSLWVSDAENHRYNMGNEHTLSKDFEGISMSINIIKCRKKEARIYPKCETRIYPNAPAIYGKRPMAESDELETWLDRAHVDRFILILPNTWDAIIKADRTQNYNFMDSMKPDHIIQENKAISVFFFENLIR